MKTYLTQLLALLFLSFTGINAYAQDGTIQKFVSTENEVPLKIRFASDGSLFLGGVTRTDLQAKPDAFICKKQASGQTIWSKTYGNDNLADNFVDMAFTDEEDLLVLIDQRFSNQAGGLNSADYLILKLDQQGNVLWETLIDTGAKDIPQGLALSPNGGCVILGITNSSTNSDFLSDLMWIELDKNGVEINRKILNIYTSEDIKDFIITADEDFYAINHSSVVKMDAEGNVAWSKEVADSLSDFLFTDLAFKKDGSLLLAGTANNNGSSDALLLQLNAEAEQIWQRFYPSNGGIAILEEIIICEESNTIIGTGLNSQSIISFDDGFYFLVTDLEGNEISTHTYGLDMQWTEAATSITAISDQRIMATGYTTENNGTLNTMLLTETFPDFECSPSVITSAEEIISSNAVIYPNPSAGAFNIQLDDFSFNQKTTFTLYNAFGQMIHHQKLNAALTQIQDLNLLPGSYFYTLQQGNEALKNGKLIAIGH